MGSTLRRIRVSIKGSGKIRKFKAKGHILSKMAHILVILSMPRKRALAKKF